MRIDPALLPVEPAGALTSRNLGDAGGITQFGLHLQELAPGGLTGERHWHDAEDAFLFLLEGSATLVMDDGETLLAPGDAACFRHGEPRGHAIANRSALPCRWLMLGSRALGDICHYTETGRRQVNGATDWRIEDASGQRLKGGALPDHLLNLAPPWGRAFDGQPAPQVIRGAAQPVEPAPAFHHPVLGGGLGPCDFQLLSDPGGLTQFGAFIESLPQGSHSSFRHWHEEEDEMAVILSGHPTLIEDRQTPLAPGDVLAWPRGRGPGHCLANRAAEPARYLVIGTRLSRDRIHYPDHDLVTEKDGSQRRYLQLDRRTR